MRQDERRAGWWAVAGLGLALGWSAMLTGCGQSTGSIDADTQSPEAADMMALGEAYRTVSLTENRPPKNMKEVDQAAAASPSGLGSLNDKNVVVFWGTPLNDLSETPGAVPSDTILAYQTTVPEQGGYVLMLDRSVKKMTPEEFAAAPKAGKEPAKR